MRVCVPLAVGFLLGPLPSRQSSNLLPPSSLHKYTSIRYSYLLKSNLYAFYFVSVLSFLVKY